MNERHWLERQTRRRDEIAEAMKRLDDPTLADLVHRATIDRRPGPSAALTEGRSGVGTHSDPTGSAAIHQQRTDLIDDWLREFEFEMALAAKHAGKADHVRALITDLARQQDRSVPKPGAGDCQACGRWVTGGAHDRIKSGFGPECYTAWIRAGRPDRVQFAAERKARADEQDQQRRAS